MQCALYSTGTETFLILDSGSYFFFFMKWRSRFEIFFKFRFLEPVHFVTVPVPALLLRFSILSVVISITLTNSRFCLFLFPITRFCVTLFACVRVCVRAVPSLAP